MENFGDNCEYSKKQPKQVHAEGNCLYDNPVGVLGRGIDAAEGTYNHPSPHPEEVE